MWSLLLSASSMQFHSHRNQAETEKKVNRTWPIGQSLIAMSRILCILCVQPFFHFSRHFFFYFHFSGSFSSTWASWNLLDSIWPFAERFHSNLTARIHLLFIFILCIARSIVDIFRTKTAFAFWRSNKCCENKRRKKKRKVNIFRRPNKNQPKWKSIFRLCVVDRVSCVTCMI